MEQHIWIVRHGDKFSSYPDCPQAGDAPCYNKTLMGDNPPLTDCGIQQAQHTAKWLKSQSASSQQGINNLLVSPYTRTLQTALPFADLLNLKLKVEYFISEANQAEGPFQPLNTNYDGKTAANLRHASDIWDLEYGGPAIPTPEKPVHMYPDRIQKAVKIINNRFPVSSGNLLIVTHATPVLSLAFGLCGAGDEASLKAFVDHQDAVGPAGVVHLVRNTLGGCISIDQTQNIGNAELKCGKTDPYKCPYDDFPAWYWHSATGAGPGKCS